MKELRWNEVASRLAGAKNYWLHTTNPNGSPNATPVWGLILDRTWYCYTERTTVKARNVEHDPRVAVHLESAADVVIVHGRLVDLGQPADNPAVVEAFEQKYGHPEERPFLPSSDAAFNALYSLEPRVAFTWTLPDTEASTRRWSALGSVTSRTPELQ